MKILLASPKQRESDVCSPAWRRIPQLSLSVLAGLTPEEHEVTIAEEEDGPLPMNEDYDVVGVTTMTATAPRAYELANKFRERGAKVVLGGIHPSVLPHEAAAYANAVVVGEAEGLWPKVLKDIENGGWKKIYRNWQPDISSSPLPIRKKRRSFLGIPPYVTPIMFSRGCPHDCEFCCVHTVYGRKQRFIPVENIIRDIAESGTRNLMFLDDNIGGVRHYALKLFKALEPLHVSWVGQASARMVLDDELFTAAVRSGCRGLFIGIESIEPEVLKEYSKSLSSVSKYEDVVKRCRESGVVFHGSFIFGLDNQSPEVFEHTLSFLLKNRVPSISANILTPYPGTRLFNRFVDEGRILHTNWLYYDHLTVSFQPRTMQPEELSEKYWDFRKRFYSLSSIWPRVWAQVRSNPLLLLWLNLGFRKRTHVYWERSREYYKWLRGETGLLSLPLQEPARG